MNLTQMDIVALIAIIAFISWVLTRVLAYDGKSKTRIEAETTINQIAYSLFYEYRNNAHTEGQFLDAVQKAIRRNGLQKPKHPIHNALENPFVTKDEIEKKAMFYYKKEQNCREDEITYQDTIT